MMLLTPGAKDGHGELQDPLLQLLKLQQALQREQLEFQRKQLELQRELHREQLELHREQLELQREQLKFQKDHKTEKLKLQERQQSGEVMFEST
jgi:predicted metal-dependent hydrolase